MHGSTETLSEDFNAVILLHRRNNAPSSTVNRTERHENHLDALFCMKNGAGSSLLGSQDLILVFFGDGVYMRSRSSSLSDNGT